MTVDAQCIGFCVWTTCTPTLLDQPCTDSALPGFCCGDACISSESDPANCGACGRACAQGELCDRGSCLPNPPCDSVPDNSMCAVGSALGVCCHGACRDLSQDNQNCGVCGQSCIAGDQCFANSEYPCAPLSCDFDGGCPDGLSCSQLNYCATTTCSGLENGLACLFPGGGGECCGGTCSDLSYDSNNCGFCGLICPSGMSCQMGVCRDAVADCAQTTGSFPCILGDTGQAVCCGGRCSDLADSSNCGSCGYACPQGTGCAGGDCTDQGGGWVRPTPIIVTTCTSADEGFLCSGQCGVGHPYALPTCCDGSCQCDCNPGCNLATCPSGICTSGGGGEAGGSGGNGQAIRDQCFPSHPDNDCLTICPVGSVCARGGCVDSFCTSGLYCAASDGQIGFCCGFYDCSDLAVDPLNCGRCGNACPAGQTCSSGNCL
jgi:hypothetical protein